MKAQASNTFKNANMPKSGKTSCISILQSVLNGRHLDKSYLIRVNNIHLLIRSEQWILESIVKKVRGDLDAKKQHYGTVMTELTQFDNQQTRGMKK